MAVWFAVWNSTLYGAVWAHTTAIQQPDMVTHCVYAIQPYNGCMHTTYSAIQPYTIQPGLWDMLTKAIAFEAFQRHRATQLNLRE